MYTELHNNKDIQCMINHFHVLIFHIIMSSYFTFTHICICIDLSSVFHFSLSKFIISDWLLNKQAKLSKAHISFLTEDLYAPQFLYTSLSKISRPEKSEEVCGAHTK